METIQKFLSDNPVYCGVMIFVVGIVLFAACVFDWDWLFGNVNPRTYNTRKIDGLVNIFGREKAKNNQCLLEKSYLWGVNNLMIMMKSIENKGKTATDTLKTRLQAKQSPYSGWQNVANSRNVIRNMAAKIG
jgi:hypothetical protein